MKLDTKLSISSFTALGALLLGSAALAQQAPGGGTSLAAELGNFDCAGASPQERFVCDVMLEEVNFALEGALLSVSRNDELFVYEDTRHVPLNTGHSCTHEAKITYQRLGALLDAEDELGLALDDLSEPVLLLRRYPVRLDTQIGVLEEFGYRFLGSCNDLGSDSYRATGSARTQASLSIAFTAGPEITRDARGNVVVSLQPRIAVSSALDDTQTPLTLSGQDLGPLAALLVGLPGTLLRTAGDLFEGESVRGTFERFTESTLRDLTFAAAPLAPDFVTEQLLGALGRQARQQQAGYANRLEERLQVAIADALGLDANGRYITTFPAATLPR